MITDFLRGVSYVPRGFSLLLAAGLRSYVWLPIVVNIIVFGGALYFGTDFLAGWLGSFLPNAAGLESDAWWADALGFVFALLRWLLLPLILLGALVVMFYTFTALANLIASPINGMLAARVEQRRTGRLPAEVSDASAWAVEAGKALGDELRKIAYFAKLGIPLLLLFVVPVINLVAPALWILYGAWVMALEYSDYSLGNHGLDFREQRRYIHQRRALHLGLGGGLLAMTLIPVLNLLAMPTGVIAAALLQADLAGSAETHPVFD